MPLPPVAAAPQIAEQTLKGQERKWRFNPEKARVATQEELAPVHTFRNIVLQSDAAQNKKEIALEFLDGAEILGKYNPIICTELYATGNLFSQLFHVRKSNDLILHPEQSDAPLEERAFNTLAAIRAVLDAVKEDPLAQKHCVEEAFIPAPCYEAKTQGLVNWVVAYRDPTKPESQRVMTKQDLIKHLIERKMQEIRETENQQTFHHRLQILAKAMPGWATQARSNPNSGMKHLVEMSKENEVRLKAEQERWRKQYFCEAIYQHVCKHLEGIRAKDGLITLSDIAGYLTDVLVWDSIDFHSYMEPA